MQTVTRTLKISGFGLKLAIAVALWNFYALWKNTPINLAKLCRTTQPPSRDVTTLGSVPQFIPCDRQAGVLQAMHSLMRYVERFHISTPLHVALTPDGVNQKGEREDVKRWGSDPERIILIHSIRIRSHSGRRSKTLQWSDWFFFRDPQQVLICVEENREVKDRGTENWEEPIGWPLTLPFSFSLRITILSLDRCKCELAIWGKNNWGPEESPGTRS